MNLAKMMLKAVAGVLGKGGKPMKPRHGGEHWPPGLGKRNRIGSFRFIPNDHKEPKRHNPAKAELDQEIKRRIKFNLGRRQCDQLKTNPKKVRKELRYARID